MSRKYLLDTNAVSDLTYRRRRVHERHAEAKRAGARIGTCPPIAGELFAGAEGAADPVKSVREIATMLGKLILWPYGLEAAKEFGRLLAELRRIGRPMQTPDIQLAAVAFTLGDCTVVSSDTDLLAVPGLKVENWATG